MGSNRILFESPCLDSTFLQFSPLKIAVALCDGSLSITRVGDKECESSISVHDGAIRRIAEVPNSENLVTGGSDGRCCAVDCREGRIVWKSAKSSTSNSDTDATNAVVCLDSNIILSGHDSGVLKVWDRRKSNKSQKKLETDDAGISSLVHLAERSVAGASGGSVFVYDLRTSKRLTSVSEPMKSEILCLEATEDLLYAGIGTGEVAIFRKEDLSKDMKRFRDHKSSVNCIAHLDEEVYVTGADDGRPRICLGGRDRIVGCMDTKMFDGGVDFIRFSACKNHLIIGGGLSQSLEIFNPNDVLEVAQKFQDLTVKRKRYIPAGASDLFFADLDE